jgi:hypothetical protein
LEKNLREKADGALERIRQSDEPKVEDLETYRDCILVSFTILKGALCLLVPLLLFLIFVLIPAFSDSHSSTTIAEYGFMDSGQVGRE